MINLYHDMSDGGQVQLSFEGFKFMTFVQDGAIVECYQALAGPVYVSTTDEFGRVTVRVFPTSEHFFACYDDYLNTYLDDGNVL